MTDVLQVENLTTCVATRNGIITAVDNVSFRLSRGATLGLVGESGSGKSMTCLSIQRLLPSNSVVASGSIRFKGEDLLTKTPRQMEAIRGREIGMILQDPMTSLNPVFTIGQQVGEVFRYHKNSRHRDIRSKVLEVLNRVRIPAPAERYHSYPHQFSGGMRQRVSIAINIGNHPDLLIADEPTTALDVTVQLQILHLLREIQQESGMAIILVTHDLNLVARFCDDVAVMYAGRIVEKGPVKTVFADPKHPYTRDLLAAIPRISKSGDRLRPIPGQPPVMTNLPKGCRFEPRCRLATERCREAYPDWVAQKETGGGGCVLGDGSGGRMTLPFIDLQDVHKAYNVHRGVFRAGKLLHAVSGVSFRVPEGSTFGLVGESGSGKSTIARMVLGAEAATSGEVRVAGQSVATLDRKQRFQLRRTLQPVLQDPYSSLNPRIRVAAIVDEPLRVHRVTEHGQSLKARVAQLLEQVGLSAETMRRYPNELSGGQRQRVAIARAISINPRCLVLDEPVSALDVSIQAQILNLLKDLQERLHLTYLLISHDLAVVSYMSDQIGVLYLGQFMEIASREDIIANARHPYTQALMAAVDSTIGEEVGRVGNAVQGEIPSPLSPPSGCPFHPRCPMAEERCRREKPALRAFGPSHQVACHFAESTR